MIVEVINGPPPADARIVDQITGDVYIPRSAPPIGDIVDAISNIWTGTSKTASGAYDAYTWWSKHGGKVKIVGAVLGGALVGAIVWRMIK